ncbi:P2 [Pseudomonas phage phi6]|uniref:RNA-directed RNA polymerase n=1 Tax=Cystovirus phi6 TaxID=10879 RepID=A1XX79_9VIRU|nr:P2 [Pseudomonas phage phi6]
MPRRAPAFPLIDIKAQMLFANNIKAQQASKRSFKEGAIETYEGLLSVDPRFLSFKNELSRYLTDHFPANVDEYGRVYGNGVRTNFFGMRHMNGFPMIPATWPLASNLKKRADADLADGPVSERDNLLFRAAVRLMFSDLEPVPLKIRKGSSTCIPYFSNDMGTKIEIAERALEKAEEAGNLMLQGKFDDAYQLHQMGGAYYVVYRAQSTDAITLDPKTGKFVSKDRMVADFEYAVTGGEQGSLFAASKDASRLKEQYGIDVPDGFFCERRRTAMGGPFALNAPIMAVAQPVRNKIYSKYAYTFHHTTRLNKEEKVKEWSLCVATDVSDHDTFWPGWLRDLICDELLNMGYAPWWVKLFETSLKLPVYVGAPAPEQGHTLLGDPSNPDLEVGLSSGQGATDLMGTLLMSITYLVMQLDHTAPHLNSRIKDMPSACRFLDSYWQGHEEIRQISKSDDAMLGWTKGRALVGGHRLFEILKEGKVNPSPYMKISYEHGGAFLGDILLYDSRREPGSAIFVGNINSMLNNQFSPEYGVQSGVRDRSKRKRPFPGLAWASMKDTYGACPIYSDVLEAIERCWWNAFGESYRAYREDMLKRDTLELSRYVASMARQAGLAELTPIDLEVLADPNKLQYKWTEADVSANIHEVLMHGVSVEKTERFLRSVMPR